MLDINEIVQNRERIEAALRKRIDHVDFTELLDWYEKRKAATTVLNQKQHQRKSLSAEIPKLAARKEDVAPLKAEVNKIAGEIAEAEQKVGEYSEKIQNFLAYLPNVPEDVVPAGGKENNEPLEYGGAKPTFDFKTKDHVELATSHRLVDFERGTKLGGRGKWVYWGDGALLEWGLINYFIDYHRRNGYTFVLPPHLLRLETGFIAGQFPKFREDVFYVTGLGDTEDPTHFLLPTAETAIAGLYAGEIIPQDKLPLQFFGYTPCYRKEAGAYRTAERGTIRGNQFNKVEMFAICHPEQSEQQFQKMVKEAQGLISGLGLHYRVSRLAAQDCSESMAKTYDLEVWIPSINDYKEVSSVSTAHTFQAIRGNIRYKDATTGKNRYIHTLNGSGLATSRVFPAILEQYQLPDGTVRVPEVLQQYVGKELLRASE